MVDGRQKCLCLIYKPILLNVGLGTSSYQSTNFFWAWEARLYYISSAGDFTVTLSFFAGKRIAMWRTQYVTQAVKGWAIANKLDYEESPSFTRMIKMTDPKRKQQGLSTKPMIAKKQQQQHENLKIWN